jgi:DNA-binding beta-propeller fold protein YncE
MRLTLLALAIFASQGYSAELQGGPELPHKVVKDWGQLPQGWNLGEASGVDVDKNDNVWVFNRGKHPVIQFDRNGKMLQAWNDMQIVSSHGLRVDPEGNIWTVDVKGHTVFKWTPQGKLLMVIGRGAGTNETKEAFNEPTDVAFGRNGEVYVSDGYVNSRVVKYNRDLDYLLQWGKKGTGDGEFNLVHDVALDGKGKVYVADRNNNRIQIFDENGKFLTKWTGIGSPWGIYYVARENAIYMCDGVNDRISRLNMEGQVTGVLSSHGRVPGKVDFPHKIAVDSTGAIYVVEIKNWRVQKFAK